MSVELQCSCGKRLRVSAEAAGGQGRCPACGNILDLPASEPSAPPSALSAPAVDASTAVTDERSGPRLERTAVTDGSPQRGWPEEDAGPISEVSALDRPPYRLAPPSYIGWVGFLGGPLGGFFLMAHNYAKVGRPAACWAMVAIGVLVTVAAVAVGFALPDSYLAANLCLGVPFWLGTYLTAKILQQPLYDAHCERGGEPVSGWVVLGFTLLSLVLTLGGAIGAAALHEIGFGDHKLQVTPVEEIYYGRNIPEADARKLAGVLQEQGFFDGVGEKSVRLHKDKEGYVLVIVLRSGFDDPQIQQIFRDIAGEVSHALGGQPVRVELCDEWETPKKKLPAQREP
jgi:hypothetical protein